MPWQAQYLPDGAQLQIHAPVMLLAAWRMARGNSANGNGARKSAGAIALAGAEGGAHRPGQDRRLIDRAGAGRAAGLPMPRAAATSRVLIVFNSAGGLGNPQCAGGASLQLDAGVIALFIAIGGAASMLAGRIAGRLPQRRLRQLFAGVLVLLSGLILLQRLPVHGWASASGNPLAKHTRQAQDRAIACGHCQGQYQCPG